MQNEVNFFLLLFSLLFSGCTTELLHSELAIEVVPETAKGAQPYYAELPQAFPRLEPLSDTFTIGQRIIGAYLTTIVPYEGIAIWKADTTRGDTLPVGFLNVEGLLDYDYRRNNPRLRISQATAHFELNMMEDPLEVNRVSEVPSNFDPHRFLGSTLGISGYINGNDYYLNCPDPDSILAGFTLEILNTPSCKYAY